MSPIGETLRTRIRMFPSLVNCSTIVWYKQWPVEALEAVAQKTIQDMLFESNLGTPLVNTCIFMHQKTLNLSANYLIHEGRYNYVTPSSYLELLNQIQKLLNKQRRKIEDLRQVYLVGVQKLLSTSDAVQLMEEELREKAPKLMIFKEETEKLAEEIKTQVKAMEPIKTKVEIEEALVNERFKEAEQIQGECEKELSKAKPKLLLAEEALNKLDPNDINTLKAMKKPPDTVRLVMEAICVLKKQAPMSIPNPKNPKETIKSYWETSKVSIYHYKK